MNNDPWTEEELADINLSYDEWSKNHLVESAEPGHEGELVPCRSKDAWRHKRRALRDGYTPTVKNVRYIPQEPEISDEDYYDAVIAFQEATAKMFPHSLHHYVEVPTNRPIVVCFPSDLHIGNEGTDHKKVREDMALIARTPDVYCAMGGDPVDNFILEKMISASRSQIVQVYGQWRMFRYIVNMLIETNSLLWVSAGNHDAWTQRVAGIDGVDSALSGIPVCYTKEGGFVHLTVGKQTYVIYRKHKPTRWNSNYNPLHFLKQMLRMGTEIEFDIGVSEHFHEAEFEKFEYRPGSKIDRVLIACGSYKENDRYAQDIGYYGGGYGVPSLILYPNRRRMIPFMSIAEALEALDGVSYAA